PGWQGRTPASSRDRSLRDGSSRCGSSCLLLARLRPAIDPTNDFENDPTTTMGKQSTPSGHGSPPLASKRLQRYDPPHQRRKEERWLPACCSRVDTSSPWTRSWATWLGATSSSKARRSPRWAPISKQTTPR